MRCHEPGQLAMFTLGFPLPTAGGGAYITHFERQACCTYLTKITCMALFLASTGIFTLHLHCLFSFTLVIIQKCHEDTQPGDPKVREKLFMPKKGSLVSCQHPHLFLHTHAHIHVCAIIQVPHSSTLCLSNTCKKLQCVLHQVDHC